MKILFFLLVTISISCNEKKEVNEDELKDFFLQFEGGVLFKKKFLLTDSMVRIDELKKPLFQEDPSLTDDDLEFINRQIRETRGGVWTKDLLDSVEIVGPYGIFRDGKESAYSFSKPYFTKDKKWCVFHVYYFSGDSCSGETILYKKENGKWKAVNYYEQIVC